MKEKLLDAWLDRLSERSLQGVLSHILSRRGWTVVHLSRHCAMEMGKDLIALDSDNKACAFQLKVTNGAKFSLKDWRRINDQIRDLCYLPIEHPSIGDYKGHHKPYLVLNGELEEEASRAIESFNITLKKDHKPKITTIVRGQLRKFLQQDYPDIIPAQLHDTKLLLELFLERGDAYLDREKLSTLLQSLSPISQKAALSRKKIASDIAAGAILTSIATSEFARLNNHVAKIEAWIIYLSYIFGLAERWHVPKKHWFAHAEITCQIIYNSLIDLLDELSSRKHLMEPNELSDSPFFRPRITYCIALMSILGIWDRYYPNNSSGNHEEAIKAFISATRDKLWLWGEAAVPQLLAYYWYFRCINATPEPDILLGSLIDSIVKAIAPDSHKLMQLFTPYYPIQEIIPRLIGIKKMPDNDHFNGRSYMLEGLTHIFVRRNYKQQMRALWPGISRLSFEEFQPEKIWQYYLWRSEKWSVPLGNWTGNKG